LKPNDFGNISPILGSKRDSKNSALGKSGVNFQDNKGHSSSRQSKHKFYIPIGAINPKKLKSTPKSKDGCVVVSWNGSLSELELG
jgi:hypothetical protein